MRFIKQISEDKRKEIKRKVLTETLYKSGRKSIEDGYLSELGSNHQCSCRDTLKLGDIFNLNWISCKNSVGQDYQYLEGFNTYDNLAYNTIIITSERRKNKFGDFRTFHELDISAGYLGEGGKIIKFNEGVNIRDVKNKCAELIIDAYKKGKWYLTLRDASNGEGCSKCAKKETILKYLDNLNS